MSTAATTHPQNIFPRTVARYFRLAENNTTIRTEIAAGVTTFLTMAYIIFVNPTILSEARPPVYVLAVLFILRYVYLGVE